MIAEWYFTLFLGPWNTVLTINRCTALLFWQKHSTFWSGRRFYGIIGAILAYPIIGIGIMVSIGYDCFSFEDDCEDLFDKFDNYMIGLNAVNVAISTTIGIATVLCLRYKIIQISRDTKDMEHHLLIQTIVSSAFFGIYCIYAIIVEFLWDETEQRELMNSVMYSSLIMLSKFYLLYYHMSSTVLLFCLSIMSSVLSKFKSYGLKLPNVDNARYTILSPADIFNKEIIKLAEEVREILEEISIDDCIALLRGFKWNSDRLLERFSDAESFDDFLMKNSIDLYLLLPPETLIDSFIRARSSFKWCPNKRNGCGKVVKIDDPEVQEIICDCGLSFCFNCDATPHSPFPCSLLQEWTVQHSEIERILNEHNTICPHCSEVYQLDDNYNFPLVFISCDNIFMMLENKLKPSVFPDSVIYGQVLENFKIIQDMKEGLMGVNNVEFISTVYKIIEDLLQKSLPLPAFSFFLDKEYLMKQSSTTLLSIEMFEDVFEKVKPLIRDILKEKLFTFDLTDYHILPERQHMILNDLRLIQTYLDNLYARIEKYNGWIFKLPEIQQAFSDCNDDDEIDVDDVDC